MKIMNDKGSAMLLAVLSIVLVSVIGVGLLSVTANSNKTTVNERSDQSIFYIAEAGLNLEKAKLVQRINSVNDELTATLNSLDDEDEQLAYFLNINSHFITTFCSDIGIPQQCRNFPGEYDALFSKQHDKQPKAKTSVEIFTPDEHSDIGYEGQFKIIINSKAHFDNNSTKFREVEQIMYFDLPSILYTVSINNNPQNTGQSHVDFLNSVAIYSSENFSTDSNQVIINGNIAANTTHAPKHSDKIVNTPPNFNIESFFIPDNSGSAINKKNETISGGSLSISNDTYYGAIKIPQHGNLTIDVGSNNVTLYVDNFEGKNQSKINVISSGNGSLNIVVKDSYKYSGTITSDNKSNIINIYYYGNENLSFSAGQNNTNQNQTMNIYNATLFVKDRETKITGGIFKGGIYSNKSINIQGHVAINLPSPIITNSPRYEYDYDGSNVFNEQAIYEK